MKLKFLTGFSDWRITELKVITGSIKPINNDLRLRINSKIQINIDPRSSITKYVVSKF